MPTLTPAENSLIPMPRAELRGHERWAVPMLEWFNGSSFRRRAAHILLGKPFGLFIRATTGRLVQAYHFERAQQLHAPKGVILVANHRSFFDFHFAATLLTFGTRWMREVTFPTRSPFFYDHPLGPLVTLGCAGGSMWPPVFRDERRRVLNPVGFAQMAWSMREGTVLGIHPEGRRSTGPTPYEFLPLKPGLGHLLLECDPEVMVMPVFIAGTSSSVFREIRRNFRPPAERGEPIRIVFGEARSAGDLIASAGTDAQALTEAAFAPIHALAAEDRARRAA